LFGYTDPTWIRQNIRHARGMPLEVCGDACTYSGCCGLCALCQDGRELKVLRELTPDPVGSSGVVDASTAKKSPPGYEQPSNGHDYQ
jgi:hypothetical protein